MEHEEKSGPRGGGPWGRRVNDDKKRIGYLRFRDLDTRGLGELGRLAPRP